MDSTDDEIVARVKAGNKEAFTGLYDRYIEKIYRFVYYKTFQKETAEDIVSSTFVKAYERIESFNAEKGTFSQWLYAIARNAVIDHYRTTKKHENIDDIFSLGVDERTEEKLDAAETLKKIEQHVSRLNARQREIVILRVWEELPYKEIAEIVGGTEDSVKMMFSRTIREIRDTFGTMAPVALLTILQYSPVVTSRELVRTIRDIL